MKQNKKCVLLALMLFAVLSFCLLVPTYAAPSVRDGVVTDRDGIIEGDTDVTLPRVTLPMQNGTMTPSEQGTQNGGSAILPGLTGENGSNNTSPSTSDRTTPSVTTNSPSSTQGPSTSAPTTTAQNNENDNGMAIWGVILAIVIIAAIGVILYMLFSRKR